MDDKQKGLTPFTLVLIGFALAVGAWFVYTSYTFAPTAEPEATPTPIKNQPEIQTPLTPQVQQTLETDTSAWQTYRNEKYGFEFKYPSNLTNDTNSFGGTLTFGPAKKIVVNISSDPKTEHCVYPLAYIGKDFQTVINGITFRKQIGETSGSNGAPLYQVNSYSTINNGTCVILSFTNSLGPIGDASASSKSGQETTVANDDLSATPEGKIFDQMLSTFRFIAPQK